MTQLCRRWHSTQSTPCCGIWFDGILLSSVSVLLSTRQNCSSTPKRVSDRSFSQTSCAGTKEDEAKFLFRDKVGAVSTGMSTFTSPSFSLYHLQFRCEQVNFISNWIFSNLVCWHHSFQARPIGQCSRFLHPKLQQATPKETLIARTKNMTEA